MDPTISGFRTATTCSSAACTGPCVQTTAGTVRLFILYLLTYLLTYFLTYKRVTNIRISAHFTHLRKFRNFVFATEVTIFSDHSPLMYLRECAPKSAKLTR